MSIVENAPENQFKVANIRLQLHRSKSFYDYAIFAIKNFADLERVLFSGESTGI